MSDKPNIKSRRAEAENSENNLANCLIYKHLPLPHPPNYL
jgi:hypothetical protein